MENSLVPQDDVLAVSEMMQKLETNMFHVFKENDSRLVISALMSATINYILGQCKNLDDVLFHRNLFMQTFDIAIKNIKCRLW